MVGTFVWNAFRGGRKYQELLNESDSQRQLIVSYIETSTAEMKAFRKEVHERFDAQAKRHDRDAEDNRIRYDKLVYEQSRMGERIARIEGHG